MDGSMPHQGELTEYERRIARLAAMEILLRQTIAPTDCHMEPRVRAARTLPFMQIPASVLSDRKRQDVYRELVLEQAANFLRHLKLV